MPAKKGAQKQQQQPTPEQRRKTEANRRRRQARKARRQAAGMLVQQEKAIAHNHVQQHFAAHWTDRAEGAILARQMAIPEAATNPIRMPTQDMPKTAVTKLTTTLSVKNPVLTLANQPSSGTPFVSGDLMFYIYGLPGFSMMYGPVVSTAPKEARLTSFYYTSSYSSYQILNSTTLQPGSTITAKWAPTKCVNQDTGALRPMGLTADRTFGWFDRTEKFLFQVWYNGVVAAEIPGPITVNIYQWVGPGEPPILVIALSYKKTDSGTFAYTVPNSGWFSFEYALSAVDTDTINTRIGIEVYAAASVATPARFELAWQDDLQAKDVGESVRRTGFSVLLTNTTAEINRQGNVIAARLVADGFYDEDFSLGTQHLDKAADKYTGDASKGVYTYMDFDNASEQFYQAHFGEVSKQALGPVFNLEYYGYIHCIKISNPTPETSANSFLVTMTGIYEFRTDSMLFTKTVPMMSNNALVDARRINNSTQYFYENPLHMSDIWKFIKNAFGQVRKAALPIGMAASAMFPEASGAIMPIAHALQV